MAGLRISRRAMVPGAAAGAATLVAAAEPAAAQRGSEPRGTCGPCTIWPGHTLRMQFFLPGRGGGGLRDLDARQVKPQLFRLVLRTLDGRTLATRDFQLRPGSGTDIDVSVDVDGTVRVQNIVVVDPPPDPQSPLVVAIIAILIEILRPRVEVAGQRNSGSASPPRIRATATSFIPGELAGEQNVDYLLPFIEQDN